MSEDGEIVLPPGTRYVTADEIPRRVAYALYPEFTGEVTVDFIKKVEVTELGVRNRTLELTPQDWERLREFWATLPPFRAGMRESTWLLYAEAAAAAVNLGWQVVPFTKKGPLGTAALRAAAEERHSEYLKQAIRNGKLTTYDHARLPNAPAQADFPDAGVKVADFAVYVEAFNLRVRVMPSSGVIEAKWVIDDLVTEQAAQSYAAHGYAGQREADKAATLSRIGRDLYNDVFELVQVGAITPVDPGSGVAVDSKATIEPGWRLTREDVEIFLRFVKFTAEGKRDFVLDRKRRQNEGRYTLKRAAMLLAGAGERYPALLTRLASAAEAEEIPTYAPGMYQRLQYGSKPGQETRVRDWYEEVYWNDLNDWLKAREPRIRFRFPSPAPKDGAATDFGEPKGMGTQTDQYRRQEIEQDGAGRLTLDQLITFLSQKTGWEYKRWSAVVVEAVISRQLSLKNPQDHADRLPYEIPPHINLAYEQVMADEADAWLDSCPPQWAVSARLRDRKMANPGQVEQRVGSNRLTCLVNAREAVPVRIPCVSGQEAVADKEPWKTEARRLADVVGLEQWNRGERQITARGVAPQVALRLERHRDYWGKQGPRDANTIRTYALKGWRFQLPAGPIGLDGPDGS